MRALSFAIGLFILAKGCGSSSSKKSDNSPQAEKPTPTTNLSYTAMKSKIDSACGSCHNSTTAAGGVDLSDLSGVQDNREEALAQIIAGQMPQNGFKDEQLKADLTAFFNQTSISE